MVLPAVCTGAGEPWGSQLHAAVTYPMSRCLDFNRLSPEGQAHSRKHAGVIRVGNCVPGSWLLLVLPSCLFQMLSEVFVAA